VTSDWSRRRKRHRLLDLDRAGTAEPVGARHVVRTGAGNELAGAVVAGRLGVGHGGIAQGDVARARQLHRQLVTRRGVEVLVGLLLGGVVGVVRLALCERVAPFAVVVCVPFGRHGG